MLKGYHVWSMYRRYIYIVSKI